MKLSKKLFGAAALVAAGAMAGAQTVNLHGKIDYSTNALMQSIEKLGDADEEKSNVAAGIDSDAKTQVDLTLNAANFEFNLGVKLNESAGDEGMGGKYTDYTDDYDGTPFYQGNMKIGFFNDQFKVYTGKFENFNAGYIPMPVISDHPVASYFASSGMGQYYTAVEASPYAINGFKIMAGLPILPVGGNSVQNDVEANQWKNLGKKINFAAAYLIPGTNIEIDAGFRPGTYYSGVKAYDGAVSEDFTKNFYSEAFLASKLDGLAEGLKMSVLADFRYRDAEYATVKGDTEEHFAFAVLGTVNAEMELQNVNILAELNGFYSGDDYMMADEKLLGTTLKLDCSYRLPNTGWSVGAKLYGKYAVDAMGTSGIADSKYYTNLTVTNDEVSAPGTGKTTNYYAYSVNPYAQYNLGNGYISVGFKLEQSIAQNEDDTNSLLTYSVPVGIVFNF